MPPGKADAFACASCAQCVPRDAFSDTQLDKPPRSELEFSVCFQATASSLPFLLCARCGENRPRSDYLKDAVYCTN
eukprot:3356039-Pyramimonas_sp.AAC.1